MKHRMNKKLACCMVCLVLISLISDGSLAATRTFSTFGLRTCVAWLKNEGGQGSGGDKLGIALLADRSWMAGYMTGLNQMRTNSDDLLAGLDLQTIIDWTDQFCQNNPKGDVTDAISALFKKLNRKQ